MVCFSVKILLLEVKQVLSTEDVDDRSSRYVF